MGDFKYINSAEMYNLFGGLGLYIKYGKTGVNDIIIKGETNKYFWIKAPDREIIAVTDANTSETIRPLNCNFDEYVSFSSFFDSFEDNDVEWLMTNYPQHLGKPSPCHCKKHNHIKWLADSGGFQIATDRISYLDPAKIVEWYNENTDYGVVLDIPVPLFSADLVTRSAHIQKKNTKIMLENKVEKLKLLNVAHGGTFKSFTDYHNIVEHADIDKLCVGDSYHGSLVSAVANTTSFIHSLGNRYNHIHLLGLYNISVLVSYIWYANHSVNIPLVTADASTHIQSAMGRLYHHQKTPWSPPERLVIGLNGGKVKETNVNKLLPCGCPVCSRLKYMDILSVLTGVLPPWLLARHNMFEINRYMKMMNDFSKSMTFKEYMELVSSQLRNKGKHDSIMALKFVNLTLEEGFKEARKNYIYYLAENRLHSNFKTLKDEYGQKPEEVMPLEEWANRVDLILKRYEDVNEVKEQKLIKAKKKKRTAMYNSSSKRKTIKSERQKKLKKLAKKRT